MYYKTIVILLLSFMFVSCADNKTVVFLKQCKIETRDSKVYLSNVEELQLNLKPDEILRYIGSDNSYHYVQYIYTPPYNDSKLFARTQIFKISIEGYTPKKIEKYCGLGPSLKSYYNINLSEMKSK